MNQNVKNNDETPDSAPQTPPPRIGMGHPEYHFVQSVMELQKSVTKLETTLEHVNRSVEDTKGKVSRFEKIMYAAGVLLVIVIAVGGWVANAVKDFALTYYKNAIELESKSANQGQRTLPPPKPKP